MKLINQWALALALAVSGATAASAAVTVSHGAKTTSLRPAVAPATTVYHVAGAASFRVAFITAEVNYLAANTTGTVTGAYAGTSGLTGNNVSLVEAPTSGGTIVFENNFSGGIAGTEGVAAVGPAISFPTASGLTLTAVTSGSSSIPAAGGTPNVTFTNESTYPDIAASDNTLATASKVIKLGFPSATISVNQGTQVLGVVPYVFLANATSDVTDFGSTVATSTVTSSGTVTFATATVTVYVTPQNFSDLWSNGVLNTNPSSPYDSGANSTVFTGNPADSGYTIFATGRDIDSGARATTLAETGFPLKGNGAVAVTQPVSQFYPLDSSNNVVGNVGTNKIESFESVPAETVDGIALAEGNGGYNSSSSEAKGLSVTIDASANPQTVLIGYIAASDAYSALTASGTNRHPAILLGYAGSTFNPAGSASTQGYATQTDINKVYAGQYTFWGYERLFYNSNNASTGLNDSVNPSTVVAALTSQLRNNSLDQLSSAGVNYSDLIVTRNDDGLQVQ